MLIECLVVGLGGFIGSVLRYLMNYIPISETTIFPINTFLINIMGALAIGLLTSYITKYNTLNDNMILFLKVGICGGFTTFSTFALETGDLIRNGDITIALLYVILSVLIGVFAIFVPELVFK